MGRIVVPPFLLITLLAPVSGQSVPASAPASAPAASAPTDAELLAVEHRIAEAWQRHTSAVAQVVMETRMERNEIRRSSRGEGRFELLRDGARTLVRLELRDEATETGGERAQRIEQRRLQIVDGSFTYLLTDSGKSQYAVKLDIDPQHTYEPGPLFAKLHRDQSVKLLPDGEVEGHPTYVIQTLAPEQSQNLFARSLLYFDRKSGFLRRIVAYDAQDRPVTTMTYTDLKLDVPIERARFVFQPPAGVGIVDGTAAARPTTPP